MIHVYSIVRNAEYLMPYFLRHYTQFAEVFIIDDHSTDKTRQIVRDHPKAKLFDYPYGYPHKESEHSEAFQLYRAFSRKADWVMCVDQDEFVYHPNLLKLLKKAHAIIQPVSYMMIADKVPSGDGQIYDEVKTGIRTPKFDKPVIFEPRLDVEFGDGRHTIKANMEPIKGGVLLLHYKYLSREYYLKRAEMDYPRWEGMDEQMMDYRVKRGLAWYDKHLDLATDVI